MDAAELKDKTTHSRCSLSLVDTDLWTRLPARRCNSRRLLIRACRCTRYYTDSLEVQEAVTEVVADLQVLVALREADLPVEMVPSLLALELVALELVAHLQSLDWEDKLMLEVAWGEVAALEARVAMATQEASMGSRGHPSRLFVEAQQIQLPPLLHWKEKPLWLPVCSLLLLVRYSHW